MRWRTRTNPINLVIQAIIVLDKSKNKQDQPTLMSIYGVLFFGVPSQSMDVQYLEAMVSSNRSKFIVSLLDREVGYRLRQRQHEDFCRALPYADSEIMQWFELRKTKTPDGLRLIPTLYKEIIVSVTNPLCVLYRGWFCLLI
jgi:hypothetical protein